jgi:hypothetical protein
MRIQKKKTICKKFKKRAINRENTWQEKNFTSAKLKNDQENLN